MRGAVAKRPAAHPCTMCNKRFTKRSNLRIHERLHTGERPYVCRFHGCGRAYKWLSSINFHEGRCERRPFGLAAAAGGSNGTLNGSGTNLNGQLLPSSPVTPVRPPPYNNHKNELVLPPATHLKRIAKSQAANGTGTHPRRRLATMPVSLPPPLPQYSTGLQSIQPSPSPHAPIQPLSHNQNHVSHQYYQSHPPTNHHTAQQSPSVLLQMARALPSAPLPAPMPFGAYTSNMPNTSTAQVAASLGLPTSSSSQQSVQHHQIQRLLGAVAPPLPPPTTEVKCEVKCEDVHVSTGGAAIQHPPPLPAIDYANGHSQELYHTQNHHNNQNTHLPLPPTSSVGITTQHPHPMLHPQQMHPQHPSQHHPNGVSNGNPNANGTHTQAAVAPTATDNSRPQCTVAGGVLDDLTTTSYPFDGEQAHPEVLLF